MLTLRKSAVSSPMIALIAALALAVVHQYLFFGHAPGLSFPLFTMVLYAYLFHDRKYPLRAVPGIGWFMLAVIVLLSMTYALFDNPLFRLLNLVVVPSLISLHMAYMRGARRLDWSDLRIVGEAFNHLLPQTFNHIPNVFRLLRIAMFRRFGTRQKSTLHKVLIGLVIAVPLLVLIIPLLASADGTFQRLLNAIPEWGGALSLDGIMARGVWIAICCVLFFGYFQGFAKPGKSRRTRMQPETADAASTKKLRIDPIILATLLISINAVYVLFVAVQFSYLFGASDGILPDGQTYAEYARSGFAELVVVSAINFALLMVSLVYGGKPGGRIAALLYVLIFCSGVMLYSAYMRLALYEEVYGYTYIRFLVQAFMIYLAFLLLLAALRIRTDLVPLSKCYIVLSLAAYVLVNYVGMDRIIAEKSIERFEESGQIDRDYLSGLSADAVPALVRYGRENADTAFINRLERHHGELLRSSGDWRSYNVSEQLARNALKEAYDK
ncbi:DUF4153 domain-containing protein [Cohnella boryungensis]|uniref:DUF4153 domain-containing protein n=1 Tax=Cohnella boryungensis TaxID=768479 RepID=A0ABV8SBA7_9BACL